jgi:hypothetical protein
MDREISDQLWLLMDAAIESGDMRRVTATLSRDELEALLAEAVWAYMEANSRALDANHRTDVEMIRFQRRLAKRRNKPD